MSPELLNAVSQTIALFKKLILNMADLIDLD